MDKLDMKSKNLVDGNIEKIAKLFPNCITEGKDENGQVVKLVDFDLLKQELSSIVVEGNDERYTLNWPGKKQAILTANSPINATLRPCREESVDFDNTQNLYIEGDNLDVLKLLRETYLNKVKMIYIDPPYNTGHDFVYEDDFATSAEDYLKASKSYDEQGNRMFQNNDTNGRFHSDWLSMMYSRLKLARDLLTDDGVIFISIDDNEFTNLKKLCDDVFDERNFIGVMPRITKKSGKQHSDTIAKNHDYVYIYAKNLYDTKFNRLEASGEGFEFSDEFESERGKYKLNQTLDYDSLWYNPTMDFEIKVDNKVFYAGGDKSKHSDRHNGNHNAKDWVWRWSQAKFDFGYKNGFVVIKEGKDRPRIYTKTYMNATIDKDANGQYFVKYTTRNNTISSLKLTANEYSNDNAKKDLAQIIEPNYFDFPKPVSLISQFIELICEDNDIVLDFFSGSATTAQSVMQYNAKNNTNIKYICVQLPEKVEKDSKAYIDGFLTICEIGKERIRRAGQKIVEEQANLNNAYKETKLEPMKAYAEFTTSEKAQAEQENVKKHLDIGFRVLKLDSSCMKNVYYSPAEISQDLLAGLEDNIKEDRTAEDLLFQVMLDMGVILSSEIKTIDIKGKKVFNVNDGNLVCCFDKNLSEEVVTEIAKMQPLYAVFRDASMSTDTVAVNFDQIFETYSPTTIRKVI